MNSLRNDYINVICNKKSMNIADKNDINKVIYLIIAGEIHELTGLKKFPIKFEDFPEKISREEYDKFANVRSLHSSSNKILGSIIQQYKLYTNNKHFGSFTNKDFQKLLTFINQELDSIINRFTVQYSKEELVIGILIFSSIVSELSHPIYYDKIYENNNNDPINKLKDLHNKDWMDLRGVIGEIKVSIESFIHSSLFNRIRFKSWITDKDIDYFRLLSLFRAKSEIFAAKEAIPILGDNRANFKLDVDEGIILPEKLRKAFHEYSRTTKQEKIRVENDLTDSLFDKFFESEKFHPNQVINYLLKDDDDRYLLLQNNYLSLADKDLFLKDLSLAENLSLEGASNVLNSFTLNTKNFYDEAKENSDLGNPNDRLFRSPIIEIDNQILIPTWTLLESLHYLKVNILERNIYPNIIIDNWNELLKKNYDEYDLPHLQELLYQKGIIATTNTELSKSPYFKKDIESTKKMPHEIDLFYFIDDTLFIKDLKNYGMQHNIMQFRKVVYTINQQKSKMNRLKNFILERKDDFEQYFNRNFDDIELEILTVSPTVYPLIQKKDTLINVISVNDFKKRF